MKRIRFKNKHKRQQQQEKKEIYPYNEQIKDPEVRVIVDADNEMLGVMPTQQALQEAQNRDLDLVLVSPKAQPPVAKIMNYGRFAYQKEKEDRKKKQQAKGGAIKVIRLSARSGQHDVDFKVKNALKFIERGDKVKFDVMLKGREKAHPEIGKEFLEKVVADIAEQTNIKLEQEVKRQGHTFTAVLGKNQ